MCTAPSCASGDYTSFVEGSRLLAGRVLQVLDSGRGLPLDAMDWLFQPFAQVIGFVTAVSSHVDIVFMDGCYTTLLGRGGGRGTRDWFGVVERQNED